MSIKGRSRPGLPVLSKISHKRQVVIPESIFRLIGADIGDYVEFIRQENEIVIKVKKLVDARALEEHKKRQAKWGDLQPTVPPPQSTTDRLAMLKDLEDDATDDSEDIDAKHIKASRTFSNRTVKFD